MEESDIQIKEALRKGAVTFTELDTRLSILEREKTYFKGYSTPILSLFAVVGILIVSGLTFGLNKILEKIFG
jgi:hypothetical protein